MALMRFLTGPFVYISIAAFVIGMAVNAYRMIKKYQAGTLEAGPIDPDISKKTVVIAMIIFHLSFVVLVFGHSRMIGDIPLLLKVVPIDFLNSSGHIFGCLLGAFLECAFLFVMYKSIKADRPKHISDIVFLGTALMLITLGNFLQFTQPYSLAVYREYIGSILHLSPALPQAITATNNVYLFVSHITLACLTAVIFPFSRQLP